MIGSMNRKEEEYESQDPISVLEVMPNVPFHPFADLKNWYRRLISEKVEF